MAVYKQKNTNKIKIQKHITTRQVLPKDSPKAFDWKGALLTGREPC